MTEVTLRFPDNALKHRFVSINTEASLIRHIDKRHLKAFLTTEQLILALELYGAVIKLPSKKPVH